MRELDPEEGRRLAYLAHSSAQLFDFLLYQWCHRSYYECCHCHACVSFHRNEVETRSAFHPSFFDTGQSPEASHLPLLLVSIAASDGRRVEAGGNDAGTRREACSHALCKESEQIPAVCSAPVDTACVPEVAAKACCCRCRSEGGATCMPAGYSCDPLLLERF